MKTGIHISAFPWSLTLEECIALAGRTGYDTLELSLDEEGAMGLLTPDETLLSYRRTAENAGVQLSSLASGLYWKYSFTADDPAVRAKAMQIAKEQIRRARVLGADTILIIPGAVEVPFLPDAPVLNYDVVYDRALCAMKELARYAEENKITVGIENVWNGFLLSPLEMRDFIDRIGSAYIRVYMDVGNILHVGYPEQWIRILGKRIARIHVKDFKKNVGTLQGFCELLEGDVPFPAVMAALREIGYDGPLTAEISSAPGAVQRTFDALQSILTL